MIKDEFGANPLPMRNLLSSASAGTIVRRISALGLAAAVALCPAMSHAQGAKAFDIYPAPAGSAQYSHHNDDFTVRVRAPGGQWQDLYEYKVMVDLDNPQPASMVTFGIGGRVEISVKKNNGDARRVEVRPDSKGVTAKLVGNTAFLVLEQPANLSIEFDGDRLHNLHLFANPLETTEMNADDPNVIYFGPGVHELPTGRRVFSVPSNKTMYLAGGALLRGQIDISHAENVRVIGPGIIDTPPEGFTVLFSRNVTIDGPTIINPKHYSVMCGQSSGVTIRNLKTFSAASWTDGIDMMSCSDVEIDNAFLRTSDDAIAIYADRWDFHGNAANIRVTDSTLWADIAHPINIGGHGNPDQPRTIEDLTFSNIDILAHDEDDRLYQGAMSIAASDNNRIRKVTFEDIRIDDIEEGSLFSFRSLFNPKYSHAPGGAISDVTVRNVHFKGGDINPPTIAGFAPDRAVSGVRIENVRAGRRALSRKDIDIGPYVNDLVVTP